MPEMLPLDDTTSTHVGFFILGISNEAPASYPTMRMETYLHSFGDTSIAPESELFQRMITPPRGIQFADASSHPNLSENIQKQHQARTACAIQTANANAPLFPNEVIQNDFFTFLTAPFEAAPARTAVLCRTTNFAQLLFIYEGIIVEESGRLVIQRMPEPPVNALMSLAADVPTESIATSIAGNLAKKLASTIGGAIGGAVFNAIFPPGVPSYFDQVYAAITKIVHQELQQDTITHINGAINNIKQHVETEYEPAKNSKNLDILEDRTFLFQLLQKYESTYLSGTDGMLGTLMDEQYQKASFGVFLLGASLQLSLFQEMANVDPSNTSGTGSFRSPLESSYGQPNSGTVAKTASNYVDYAKKVWLAMQQDRRNAVTFESGGKCAPFDQTGSSCRYYLWYIDSLGDNDKRLPDGTKVTDYLMIPPSKESQKDKEDQFKQQYNDYIESKVQDLSDSLSAPNDIIASWQQLIKQPITL